MKLLFATNIRPWGGGEQWMLTAALAMRERGHEVSLAAPADAAISERARAAELQTVSVGFVRDFDPAAFARLYLHLRSHGIEAICLNMDRVLRICGLAARAAGVPVVLPRRGSEFALKDKWVYRFNYQALATGMIVNSQATARTLCQGLDWRPAGRVHVLMNGLDTARFANAAARETTRRGLGIADEAPAIVVLGELTGRKNARLLLGVMPDLLRRHPDLQILLIGEGEEESRLREQAASLEIESSVRFLGFRRDVPDLLAAADLLVHPARVEGFGFAVAEGMAAGLPVVATAASSIPEIVEHGETGFLFPPEDADALRDAIARYLGDPALRRRHGDAGRDRVSARFELSERSDELEQILQGELRRAAGN